MCAILFYGLDADRGYPGVHLRVLMVFHRQRQSPGEARILCQQHRKVSSTMNDAIQLITFCAAAMAVYLSRAGVRRRGRAAPQ